MMSNKSVVIVGFGNHAQSWKRQIEKHPDFSLDFIVDVNPELLEYTENSGIIEEGNAYMSIDDLMAMSDKKPDLAIIATPIYTHHVLVKETMDHGINVISEKNMASTIYQGRQMVDSAIEHPELCTAVGTQYRYFTKNWVAKQFLQQEDCPIGELAYMKWESAGNWGEKRRGWRRFLQEIYLEDMCTHWFDLLRYQTGMDVVQVKCDTFIPKYSAWQGSSTCFVNCALAHPDDYDHRHNWVWVQLYGDWQRRGPGYDKFEYFGGEGQAELDASWGMKLKIYQDEDGKKWDEDGFIPMDAGSIEGLDVPYQGQGIILEMMRRGIDSKGKNQPGTNYKDAFKSFAVSMAAIESSRNGHSVYVPKYWDGLFEE